MRSHHTFRIGLALAAGTLAAGCGADSGTSSATAPSSTPSSPSTAPSTAPSSPAGAPSSDPAPLPTITLTDKPPREPTDNLPETGWVAGMVTRGGTGPCYGLTADDGTRYALYSADGGITLTQGGRVKVKLETTLVRIYCGPGRLMAMTTAEPIG